jgi:hypothetical protein
VGLSSADVLEVRQLTAMSDIPERYIELARQAAPSWVATQLPPRAKS